MAGGAWAFMVMQSAGDSGAAAECGVHAAHRLRCRERALDLPLLLARPSFSPSDNSFLRCQFLVQGRFICYRKFLAPRTRRRQTCSDGHALSRMPPCVHTTWTATQNAKHLPPSAPPSHAAESLLNGWKARTDAFELVQWDVALEGQDPHAVGVAVKGQAYRPGAGAGASSEERRVEREAREARERAEREAKKEKARLKKDKGFDKGAGKA